MDTAIRKILVIDDSEFLQMGYNILFLRYRNDGCQVIRAGNGQEGLDRLRENPDTDLIILDINMPVMSGLEFLRRCKRQPATTRIPVIISSSEGAEEDIISGLKEGAAAYLVKPFKAEELHSLIAKLTPNDIHQKTSGL